MPQRIIFKITIVVKSVTKFIKMQNLNQRLIMDLVTDFNSSNECQNF